MDVAAPTARLGTAEPPLVEVRGLGRRFGRLWALAGVDLRLAPGEALLLAGSNGSGKSTLLRVLAGALRADRGEVLLRGASDRDALRRATALLGHASFTYEPLSALENLELFARLLGLPSGRAALLARLEEVGLAGSADAPVATFSAGMHKRLALARLRLQTPLVALLDEPHSALDPQGARLVDDTVRALKRAGAAVVLATHRLVQGASLCERGIVLERGRIQWEGAAKDLIGCGLADEAMEGTV